MIPGFDVPVSSESASVINKSEESDGGNHQEHNQTAAAAAAATQQVYQTANQKCEEPNEAIVSFKAEPRPLATGYQLEQSAEEDADEEEEEEDWADYGFGLELSRLTVKSVIVHKLESGYGLRLEGQTPVRVEHVHEGGAAWRAGVRPGDILSKVNGDPVSRLSHRDVVLRFKSSSKFVGLTLLTEAPNHASGGGGSSERCFRRASIANGAALIGARQSSGAGYSALMQHRRRSSGRLSSLSMNSNAGQHLLADYFQLRHPTGSSISSINASCIFQSAHPTVQRLASSSSSQGRSYEEIGGLLAPPRLGVEPTALSGSASMARRSESVSLQDRTAYCINCRQPLNNAGLPTSPLACFNCQLLFSLPRPHQASNPNQLTVPHQQQQQHQQQQLQRTSISSQSNTFHTKDTKTTVRRDSSTYMKISHSAHNISEMQRPIIGVPVATNKRLEVIKEFLDTEKAHTERLKLLDDLFYKPLKEGGLMTHEQLRSVFSCHRTLFKIHRQIHRTLLSASYNLCAEPMIGSALLEIFEGDLRKRLERATCSFCATQSTNVQLLNKLTRRDTKVGDFIAQVSSQQMVGRLGIKDLLASCFQRLTKYPLLLENLLKATPQESLPPPPAPCTTRNGSITTEHISDLERSSRRMLAIGLAEEREFISRALEQSRQILFKVNESVKQALAHKRLQEIWKRTDKYPGVPPIDISNQHIVHEGQLALRLSRRTFDVFVLLLSDYLVILLREGHDKYRLKFFNPESRLTGTAQGSVYSPVFVIDEHLSTRDAATDENSFYLLCKSKDDSRIYEFTSRSPAERIKWRDKIQWSIDHQQSSSRRPSAASNITKSSSEISNKQEEEFALPVPPTLRDGVAFPAPQPTVSQQQREVVQSSSLNSSPLNNKTEKSSLDASSEQQQDDELARIEGTISYVEDDGIVMPNKMESSRALVDQAVQLSIFGIGNPLIGAIL